MKKISLSPVFLLAFAFVLFVGYLVVATVGIENPEEKIISNPITCAQLGSWMSAFNFGADNWVTLNDIGDFPRGTVFKFFGEAEGIDIIVYTLDLSESYRVLPEHGCFGHSQR